MLPTAAPNASWQQGGAFGTPGASAMTHYQQARASQWASFVRSLPWRLAGVIAAGVLAGTLTHSAGPRLAGPAAALAAGLVGWRLRFRVSAETAAWRRGARGERRTARALRKLIRQGWTVLHDVAIPGSRANGDHLLIGPPGVFLVDSKAWHGHITQAIDGQAWHNGHHLDQVIATVRWEAEQVAGALGASVLPLLCVHDTDIPWDEIYVDNVPVLTPTRPLALLRSLPAHMDQVGVMLLTEHARHQVHPAT
ncbi:MAG TPA: nuclease-related domain-containing protein [Actinomycetes bacterium]